MGFQIDEQGFNSVPKPPPEPYDPVLGPEGTAQDQIDNSETVVGAIEDTGQLIVKDNSGNMYYKPGTPDQVKSVINDVNTKGKSTQVYVPPAGVSHGKPVSGSNVDNVDRFAAVNKKWAGNFKGDMFIGTDLEYQLYVADWVQANSKPIRIYDYKGDIKSVNPGVLDQATRLRGRDQFDYLKDKGIIDPDARFVPGKTDDDYSYIPGHIARQQDAFEDDLKKNHPDLYKIYKDKGIQAYNTEVQLRNLAISNYNLDVDAKNKQIDADNARNKEIQDIKAGSAMFQATKKQQAYDAALDRFLKEAPMDQKYIMDKVLTVQDAQDIANTLSNSKNANYMLDSEKFKYLSPKAQQKVINYYAGVGSAKDAKIAEGKSAAILAVGMIPVIGTAANWNSMNPVERGVSIALDALAIGVVPRVINVVRIAMRGAEEVKILNTINATLKEQRAAMKAIDPELGKSFDGYVKATNDYAKAQNKIETLKRVTAFMYNRLNAQKRVIGGLNNPEVKGAVSNVAQTTERTNYAALTNARRQLRTAETAAKVAESKLNKASERLTDAQARTTRPNPNAPKTDLPPTYTRVTPSGARNTKAIRPEANRKGVTTRIGRNGEIEQVVETQRVTPSGYDSPSVKVTPEELAKDTKDTVMQTINETYNPKPVTDLGKLNKQIAKTESQIVQAIEKGDYLKEFNAQKKLSDLKYQRNIILAGKSDRIALYLRMEEDKLPLLIKEQQRVINNKGLKNVNPDSYNQAVASARRRVEIQRNHIKFVKKTLAESLKNQSSEFERAAQEGGKGGGTATKTKTRTPTKTKSRIQDKTGKTVITAGATIIGGAVRGAGASGKSATSSETELDINTRAIGKPLPKQITTFDPAIRVLPGRYPQIRDINRPGHKDDDKTGPRSIIKPVTRTNTGEYIKPSDYTNYQPGKKLQPKAQEQPAIKTELKTKVEIKNDKLKPRLKIPKDYQEPDKETPVISNPNGAVAWPQGELNNKTVWNEIEHPYKRVNTTVGRAPKGAVVINPKKSPTLNIQTTKTGKIPDTTIDMGIQDIAIHQSGKRVNIRFRADPHQRTNSDLRIGRPTNPIKSKKVGKIYHTHVNGGTLLSRHPLGRKRH